MRTVICDDDEKLCRILQIFLEEYGESRGISVDVEVFSDGEILLQQLETGKQYDLLFLDIIMKHVDGIRVGEFVRNRMEDFHTRILYMSGSKEHLLEPDSAADGGKQLLLPERKDLQAGSISGDPVL